MACCQPRLIAGRISQNRAAGQGASDVAHIQRAVQGQCGAGAFHGIRLRGRAKKGNEALQPGGEAAPPARFLRQMRKFQMRVRVDAGRGEADSAHIAHQRTCG